MCCLSVPNFLLVQLFAFAILNSVLARDVCNLNVVLREMDTFKLSQEIKKEVSLDYSAYTDLFNSLSENKLAFETTVQNYTDPKSYLAEEPYTLLPLDSEHNLFKLEAVCDDFALEC